MSIPDESASGRLIGTMPDLQSSTPAIAEFDKELLRAISESFPAGICVIRWPDRQIIWINSVFTQLLARLTQRAVVLGQSIDEAFAGSQSSWLTDMLQHVAVTGAPVDIQEHAYDCFDSGRVYIDGVIMRLFPLEHDGPVLMLQMTDVTTSVTSRHNVTPLDKVSEHQGQTAVRQREMFETVLSNTQDRHYVHDLEGRFVYANKTMCDRLRMPLDQLIGKRMEDFPYPAEWIESFYQRIAEIREKKEPRQAVFYMETFTGQPEWFEANLMPVLGGDGEVQFIAGNSRDITSQKQAEIALRQALEHLTLAVEATDLGTFDYYPLSGELVWSGACRRHFGVSDTVQASLDLFYEALCAEYHEQTAMLIAKALKPSGDGRYKTEYRIKRISDDVERWIRATGQAIFNENRQAIRFIGTTQDITDSKEAEQRILDASKHDALTGLPNRALVNEYGGYLLALAERTQTELAVLFIDLDRFKPINDQYGHEAGDKVLQETATRIAACTRKADIVGRIGGDEFLVILSHLDGERGAQSVAEHISQRVTQPIRVGEVEHRISCSTGISLFPQHGRDVDRLTRTADLAMYAAKAGGRNGYALYTAELEAQYHGRVQMEQWLRQAVNRNELFLLYQPVIDLTTREVVGVEALVRLPYGDGIYYSPAQFIAIAEAAGLIDRLGTWVIEEACRQHIQWREQGLPSLRISVNVSPLQFRRKNFAQDLIDIIHQANAAPDCVEIEVTESTVIENLEQTIETLTRIREKGIRVALDDFGTGYSSLSQLANLPLDTMKIDQSFVKSLTTAPSSMAIVEMIIALGKAMHLDIVGEGIENDEDLQSLYALGCGKGQGYLFSIPLSADAFVNWYNYYRAEC